MGTIPGFSGVIDQPCSDTAMTHLCIIWIKEPSGNFLMNDPASSKPGGFEDPIFRGVASGVNTHRDGSTV